MRIGFTGTREGMALDQWQSFVERILDFEATEWHDGDCIGADTQAHKVVEKFSEEVSDFFPELHGHPCNLEKYRGFNDYHVLHETLPPLKRNRIIVASSDLMFAAPKEFEEQFRGSGTWATIRYARQLHKPLIILWPDGETTRE